MRQAALFDPLPRRAPVRRMRRHLLGTEPVPVAGTPEPAP